MFLYKAIFRKGFSSLLLTSLLSAPAFAGFMGEVDTRGTSVYAPWSITGSIGYTYYQDMFQNDGQSPVGRFAIGRDLFASSPMAIGLEFGIQNGNTMRLSATEEQMDALGGLPVDSTVKPMIDLLVTLTVVSPEMMPFFGQLKGGVAYRRLQFGGRDCINDKSDLAAEIQVGGGVMLNQRISLNLFYQGVFGDDPNYHVNTVTRFGIVDNIPAQHSVLLGLTLSV